jgi:hypothetical protein
LEKNLFSTPVRELFGNLRSSPEHKTSAKMQKFSRHCALHPKQCQTGVAEGEKLETNLLYGSQTGPLALQSKGPRKALQIASPGRLPAISSFAAPQKQSIFCRTERGRPNVSNEAPIKGSLAKHWRAIVSWDLSAKDTLPPRPEEGRRSVIDGQKQIPRAWRTVQLGCGHGRDRG